MARVALGLAGIITGVGTVQMLRNGVWTRAEVVAEEMRAMEAEVPGLDSNPKIRRDTLEVGMLDDVRQQARKVQTRVWNQTVRQVVGPDSYLASHLAPRKHVAKKDEE